MTRKSAGREETTDNSAALAETHANAKTEAAIAAPTRVAIDDFLFLIP
jgi:hypothetical protein